MKVEFKRKLSKILIYSLMIGNISISGIEQNADAKEIKEVTIVSASEEEATSGYDKETTTTKEIEKTDESETQSLVADETESESIEETTQEETTQEETTVAEIETTTSTDKSKVIRWRGKVVPGATMKGIDVSHHNGKINWKKVAASDIDYAIIRCGYGSNYTYQDDKQWNNNIKGCEKYKIPYGVYIYSYAKNITQAKSEAAHVLRLIKGCHLSFPIYYDLEDYTQLSLSASQRKEIADTFLKIIKDSGYECGIYANLNWWNNYIPLLANTVQYKWVAQYNTKCTYKGTYQMWQCTSTEKVDGIEGYTDLNFWYGKVRDVSYNIYKQVVIKRPDRSVIKSVVVGKKKATIKWKSQKKAVGYKIQYSTSKKFLSKKTKYTSKTKMTLTKLKSKKKYYFRVKAYCYKNGKKLYSKLWSKVAYKKIK